MSEEIKNILEERLKKDSAMFFVDTIVVNEECGYYISQRKALLGLKKSGQEILHHVYDEVRVINENLVVTRIDSCFALFNLSNNQWMCDFNYVKVKQHNDFLELISTNDIHYWFDISHLRFISRVGYDDINTKPNHTEFLWAQKGHFFDYIHRKTGDIVSPPGVIMAYDTETGIFGRCNHFKVSYFDKTGLDNPEELRKIVMNAGGYLELQNHTFNIQHYIDVNGIILNL